LIKTYHSKSIKKEIIKRGYVPHIPYKREIGQLRKITDQKRYSPSKDKRGVVERTNAWWHNRFRKLFTRYEEKFENYLGFIQLSCSIILYI